MSDPTVQRELYRIEEACQALGLSRSAVFRLMASGELDSVKVGRARRIPRTAINRYLSTLTGGAA